MTRDQLKVYLDDERPTPEGWLRTYTVEETIKVLEDHPGSVSALSLDHDLGEGFAPGYDVLLWLEEQVAVQGFIPPAEMLVHSANSGARGKMLLAIESIRRLAG